MTFQALEKYSSTMERVFDKDTGKLISNALSTRTLTNQEVLISTITYSSVSPAESKVTVYKLSPSKKE
jgi:serine/threonine-protein kinase RIO1